MLRKKILRDLDNAYDKVTKYIPMELLLFMPWIISVIGYGIILTRYFQSLKIIEDFYFKK